jgi:hypothetical protein
MSFTDLGYSASNEISPDAWKEYMLGNLAKQDAYQQDRLNQYIGLQERARAKAKREQLVAGIKSGLQYGMQKAMTPAAEQTIGTTGAVTTASGATVTPTPALPQVPGMEGILQPPENILSWEELFPEFKRVK